MSADPVLVPPLAVCDAFAVAPESLERALSGLINPTWYAHSRQGAALVLQRVNPIFAPEVHFDIAAVTEHLAGKGLLTPRLVPTKTGTLWLEHEGTVWRVLTRIVGVCHDALATPHQAHAAGQLLARFHQAVGDLEYSFRNRRLGVHDTARHLRVLREALVEHRNHRHFTSIAPLAERVLALAESLPALPITADRVVHGDPKISNLMFAAGEDRGLCMIDLDTLARMPVALELGDALRSWCNPANEDATTARFVREFFDAAVSGYASAAPGLLNTAEWQTIPVGTLTVCVELAARFCADALNERYFGWNRARYSSASEHNQARARGQLQVASGIQTELARLEAVTARAFGAH